MNWVNWVCYSIGFVFITSGAMKLINTDFITFFHQYGLPYPNATLFLVAIVEIACGALIISQLYSKYAAIPLLIIMAGALYFTKLPIIMNQGILSFAFEARLDIVMIILLLLVWQHVPGKKL